MSLVIYDIDDTGFYVHNNMGDGETDQDFIIGYSGEPDNDSSGTLEFELINNRGITEALGAILMDAVRDEAPYAIYQYMRRKAEVEADLFREDSYL